MQKQAETLRVISLADEALDTEAMPQGLPLEYVENRENIELVTPFIRPGAQPMFFVVREMSNATIKMIRKQPDEIDRLWMSFQMGVAAVENLRIDGTVMNGYTFARNASGPLKGGLTDEEMEHFDSEQIEEIGEVAFTRSFFRNRTERFYRVPRSWLERWGQVVARRVEPTQESQDPNNSPASAGLPAGTAPKTTAGSTSAGSTDATAQANSQAAE